MSDRIYSVRYDPHLFLRWTAMAFAIGFSAHVLDHVRRGVTSAPTRVIVIGTIQGLLAVLAVWMTLSRNSRAPLAAMLVGFGSALLFMNGHLLPISLDSYVTAPDASVSWFSWLTAFAEIGTGLTFGAAGLRLRRTGTRPRRAVRGAIQLIRR